MYINKGIITEKVVNIIMQAVIMAIGEIALFELMYVAS